MGSHLLAAELIGALSTLLVLCLNHLQHLDLSSGASSIGKCKVHHPSITLCMQTLVLSHLEMVPRPQDSNNIDI